MHEAEQYLRNPANPWSLYVMIGGKRRRLFINRNEGQIGIIAPRKKTHGYIFSAWDTIERICYPVEKRRPGSKNEMNRRMIEKYQREASRAGFTNPFLRKIANADPVKSLYENGITTGTRIDGQIVSLAAVQKWCGNYIMKQFSEAVRNHVPFSSGRFDFRGYDGSLWVETCDKDDGYYNKGDLKAGFSKEFRNCGNGYYYLLINEEHFIGYDID